MPTLPGFDGHTTLSDSRLRRPLSRGFDETSYLAAQFVSFRVNRQLSGWNLPPQMMRAFEAHSCQRHNPLFSREDP